METHEEEGAPASLDLGEVYRWFVQTAPAATIASDAQGRILVFNPAAERLLGCPCEVAQRVHSFADFFVDARDFGRILEILDEEAGSTRSIRLRSLSGEVIPSRCHLEALRDPSGNLVAVLGIFEDRRETEGLFERLEQATRQLIEGERRFEALEKVRALAMEMNQPLTVAMGSLEILSSSVDVSESVRVRLDRAYEQLQRVARMVRKVSSSSRKGRAEELYNDKSDDPAG